MQNSLRPFRKKTECTLEGISQLLDMPYGSTLSRCERQRRKPTIEIIFAYHIIFNVPIEDLCPEEAERTQKKIAKNIHPLVQRLEQLEKTRKNKARIEFLHSLKTLIETQNHE